MTQGAGALSLATRIRITQSRIDALRAGGGEYHDTTRQRLIAQAESCLSNLWIEASAIARAI